MPPKCSSSTRPQTRDQCIANAERAIVSFGGMTNFMRSYGLKMHNIDDIDEGKLILRTLAETVVDNGEAQ